jgi:hypothetical protein
MRVKFHETSKAQRLNLAGKEIDLSELKIAGLIFEDKHGNLANVFCWGQDHDFKILSPGESCSHTLSDLVGRIKKLI